jgi:ATP-dependent helicase/nuclease subunit A
VQLPELLSCARHLPDPGRSEERLVRQPTDSQWQAVHACDAHTLVEAGAGTGKTFTVVQRILYLLGVEIRGERYATPVDLQQIIAITFTRQAAADLKRDLRKALRDAGIRRLSHSVDLARIGTIHGFCSDLVREQALRSGNTPLKGTLEEGEALAWAEACVRDELLSALETRAIGGLDVLLGMWDTAKVEAWVLRLLRSDALSAFRDEDHEPEERALIMLARRSLQRLEQRLREEGTIDYDRMISWTRDLLREHTGVLRALQRRTHTLIIDEFQDTDSVQRDIAYLLAEPESGRADTPRLMLVGDPKQSIYRFRGADVTVWSRVRRDFEERGFGRVLRLTDNWRSVPSILSFVESTAGRMLNTPMDEHATTLADYEVEFHAVNPTQPEAELPSVEVLVVPARDDGRLRSAGDRRGMEAEAVATRMVELKAAGVEWRDMVLLLRTWSNMDLYTSAMRRAGVPLYALRDDDFLETREVLDLLVALQAIRDPRDDLAVMGFLRSPFVASRDDTLLAVAVHGQKPYARWLQRVTGVVADDESDGGDGSFDLPESERLAWAASLLHELSALRDRTPAAQLLEELLYRTGYMAHLALLGERGAQAALNVRRFLQMIGGMEADSVGLVLRAIAERRARGDRIPQARLHGEQDDVVLITSVHMAKGLDWPVVFYGDLAGAGGADNDRLIIGRGVLRLGEPDLKGEEQPERWRALRDAQRLEEDAEDRRVTYVAMTRPKSRLILAGVPQGSGSLRSSVAGSLIQLLPGLDTAEDGDLIEYPGENAAAYAVRVRMAPAAAADHADEPAHAAVLPALLEIAPWAARPAPIPASLGLTRHSATELLTFSRCQRRHRLKYVFGIREPKPDGRGGDGVGSSVARGQIVHDVLERYEEDAELDVLLEDAIGRWIDEPPAPTSEFGAAYRAELTAEIERVLALPEYAAIATAAGSRRELQFLHVLDDGTAVQGAIDLAAAAADGLTLLDVKTSRITAGEAPKKAAEYAPQQDVYVAAASALSPLPVRSFGFIFSAPAVGMKNAVDAAEADAAAYRVMDALTLLGEAPDALTTNPRECYFCGYRRARLCEGVREEAPSADGDQLVLI